MANANFIARIEGGQLDLEAIAAGDAEAIEWCELVFAILANKSRKECMQ